MAQIAKLDVQIAMRSSADKVYDIFRRKMYLMPRICPDLIKEGKVVKGDWETAGSVRVWKYVAGLSEDVKETVEAIDDGNMSITLNALDGDFEKYYKILKGNVTVTASGQGGSMVKWTAIYQKQSPNIPDPDKYLELASGFTKAVDAYLLKQ